MHGYGQPLSDKKLANLRDLLSDLKIIIIDEFSMVSADMLLQVHQRMVQIFQTDESELFAGKSVILVGDLLQLPPVNATPIYNPPKNLKFRHFNDVEQVFQQFEPYELKENHRQGEGNAWANCLNELRIGNVTKEATELLESRITIQSFLEESAMHVMYRNDEVNEHNNAMLECLPEEEVQVPAHMVHPDWYTPSVTQNDADGTGFLGTLKVKVGARVKLIYNVSVADNLVNGSLGKVVGIERNEKNEVSSIIVAFDDKNAGERQRAKYPFLSQKYADQNGTPIMRHDLEYQLKGITRKGKNNAVTGRVIQFPLKLAWAQTAHSMQVQHLFIGIHNSSSVN